MGSLYGLTSELRQLELILESECSEELATRNEELIAIIQSKTDAVVYYKQQLDDYLDAVKKRESELKELRKITESQIEKYSKYVKVCMDQIGAKEIKGNLNSIKFRKGRESVEVYDEKILPPDFFRTKTIIEVDKEKIKKALDAGEMVDGAKIKQGEETVMFKVGK
jgi:phage host-nuclease inhibitor protein Gam